MIVLKKENIISTGPCQHLHFFFFRSYEATWGSSFPFPLLIKGRDYSMCFPWPTTKYTGFRLGTHFREDRGRGEGKTKVLALQIQELISELGFNC